MSKYKTGVVRRLVDKGIITKGSIPQFVPGNVQYETIMGSMAYGVSSDASDMDVYGFCMPPKDHVFPHLAGQIQGFGKQIPAFQQYQQHHLLEPDRGKEYDLSIYSIVKYFQLCMVNNPNMIDSLFTPNNCVLFITPVGQIVRDNRQKFLHKGSWHKFRGYAYSQMHKMRVKEPDPKSKRYESVMKHGYDVKFAYHVVRLLDEVEQILTLGDIDLQRNREQLKSIRRGEWKIEDIENYFERREKELSKVYTESKLQYKPDEEEIKKILLFCLEEFYGNLEKAVNSSDKYEQMVREIQRIVN
jgi:predicted nucleotidyltransferase